MAGDQRNGLSCRPSGDRGIEFVGESCRRRLAAARDEDRAIPAEHVPGEDLGIERGMFRRKPGGDQRTAALANQILNRRAFNVLFGRRPVP